ncbi:MAG TPA: hypothetical protein VG096_09275 [Bryobacteraceae bacterium]|jgi:hypothetical protein|nr:hypothetical protein [Bryobacteraceae bacterium]
MQNRLVAVIAAALWFAAAGRMYAQPGRGAPPAPVAAREAAPADLTGYWVSIVTEDWRFRMITPPKGDYASVPLNPEGRRVADTWDPAIDEAAGEQCKSYGAAGLMRVPGRLHLTWQDENTLKIETDAGKQTRLLHFGGAPAPAGEQGWQGYSAAEWQMAGGRGRGASTPKAGSLKVVTTHLKPGYLRKNGVPYSANTVLTEYYTRTDESNGDTWLIVTTIVDDPKYLQQPFVTSTHFKKQADAAKWNPTDCTSR